MFNYFVQSQAMTNKSEHQRLFEFFNEIGIINQLASNRFERALPKGLTLSQFSVLNNFARLGGTRTPAQLADAFQVTKGAMTNTLKKLALRGCIDIQPDPADGRSKIVTVTDAGLALRETALQAAFTELADIGDMVDADWVVEVLTRLREVRSALDEARQGSIRLES